MDKAGSAGRCGRRNKIILAVFIGMSKLNGRQRGGRLARIR